MTAAVPASLVEVVEAVTIVLAVGITTGWRPALLLMAPAFGPPLALVPVPLLRGVVGRPMRLFGMRGPR